MSSTLVWEPIVHQPNASLDDELKFILRKDDGLPRVFTRHDINYLHGLSDAGVKGAAELIEAIQIHDEVKVYEEY